MFQIDSFSRTPIFEQIVSQIEKLICTGLLHSGDKLPSVRALSVQLSVNPNTIQRAYGVLDAKGVVVSVPGKGCFISDKAENTIITACKNRLLDITALAGELKASGVDDEEILCAVKNGLTLK